MTKLLITAGSRRSRSSSSLRGITAYRFMSEGLGSDPWGPGCGPRTYFDGANNRREALCAAPDGVRPLGVVLIASAWRTTVPWQHTAHTWIIPRRRARRAQGS